MESEEILGPQLAFTGQPAPQSLESNFLSPTPGAMIVFFIIYGIGIMGNYRVIVCTRHHFPLDISFESNRYFLIEKGVFTLPTPPGSPAVTPIRTTIHLQ